MWNSIEDDTKLLSLSKFTKKMKTGFPAKLLTAKYKFIPCMFQSYIFVFLCAFLYCLLVVSFMCVCLCVCVFFLLCVIATRTLCNIPYRLQIIFILCIC